MAEEHAPAPADAAAAVRHIKQLLIGVKTPELTGNLAEVPELCEIHAYIVELRRQLRMCAKGDFSGDIPLRGSLAGAVKSLQANMKHLVWQMERVQEGDLEQRIDFMGDFSDVFNNMVRRMDEALAAVREKENELVMVARELRQEVEKRGAALSMLKKSEENFRYLAEHDPLTNLLNRRSFFAQAEVKLIENSLLEHASCIALMDVDHFKKLNDNHGHLNGDLVLRRIADIGYSTLRSNDSMGRYGGEEFIFLFSKADLVAGRMVADRIRHLIAQTPVLLEGQEERVTVSFGVTSIAPKARGENLLSQAVACADKALYEAKMQGRDRVCVAEFGTDTSVFRLRKRDRQIS